MIDEVLNCDFDSKILTKESLAATLNAENQCLKLKVRDLEKTVEESENKVSALEKEFVDTKIQLLEYQRNLDTRFAEIKSEASSHEKAITLHNDHFQDYIDTNKELHQESFDLLNLWLGGLLGLLVLAGLGSLFFISNYRQKEIDRLVDQTKERLESQLSNDETMKSLVTNSLSDSEIRDSLLSHIQPSIETSVRDIVSDMNERNEGAQQTFLNMTRED